MECVINPKPNPSAILKEKGIMMRVTNVGAAIVKSFQDTSLISESMNTPTRKSAGVVAEIGIIIKNGAKNKDIRKSPATTSEVKPVLPPCSTPAADST